MLPRFRQIYNQVCNTTPPGVKSYALRFLGGSADLNYGGHNVNHGLFWTRGAVLGNFWWEAWTQPLAGANYWLSDGHGGSHDFLCGWDQGASQLGVSGNFWNQAGAAVVSFSSVDKIRAGTLHHTAVGWDGTNIKVYLDGVLTNSIAYSGNRGNIGGSEDGILYIGGSDHANFIGWIFKVRGFEGTLPMTDGAMPLGYFYPEQYFRAAFGSGATHKPCQFLADYTIPANIITDHSAGYNNQRHPGVLSIGNDYASYSEGLRRGTVYPTFELKPFRQTAYSGPAPSAIPTNALLFDEFRRQDVVPAWLRNEGALPANTAPTGQVWTGNVGIIGEKLYGFTGTSADALISHVQANVDVTITNGNTTVNPLTYVRYTDANNYLTVSVENTGGPKRVVLRQRISGSDSLITQSADVGVQDWTSLRVVANGANVDVYRNGSLVIDNATVSLLTGIKAGANMVPLARLAKIEAYPI